MVAQRGHGVGASAVQDKPKGPKPQSSKERSSTPPRKSKLSFKEKHALETLPAKLEALRADAARIQETLADPAFFARDPAAFKKSAAELEKILAAIAESEDEWLSLELLREELES
jgi:ATP-binding cassette subfamily F protein uup